MTIDDCLQKSRDGEGFSREELIAMLSWAAEAPQTTMLMAQACRLSRELSGNRAEIHAQLALNLAPCPKDCLFCSFAAANRVFHKATQLSPEEAVAQAGSFERDGANAIYVMATAGFDFGRFCEIGAEIKRQLRPETVLIANVGDTDRQQAAMLRRAGFQGVYHALRLGEGRDTRIEPQERIRSIRLFQEAGLLVGTCVEPIGPEHGNEEIADAILFTASIRPAFSGAARRIPIPGTAFGARGMISELRLAQIVAITRLAVPPQVRGNCAHEPGALPALAGANLFWAEAGANPRDFREKTEEGRGHGVAGVQRMFAEVEWGLLQGSSAFFSGAAPIPQQGENEGACGRS